MSSSRPYDSLNHLSQTPYTERANGARVTVMDALDESWSQLSREKRGENTSERRLSYASPGSLMP